MTIQDARSVSRKLRRLIKYRYDEYALGNAIEQRNLMDLLRGKWNDIPYFYLPINLAAGIGISTSQYFVKSYQIKKYGSRSVCLYIK